MSPADLDRLLESELKQLPTPHAPATLLPRVMAATVHRAALPWYARGWSAWPRSWQVASSLVLAASVGGFLWLQQLAALFTGRVADLVGDVRTASTLMRVTWQVLIQPVGLLVLVLVISMLLACAVLWTALDRVALGEAPQS
jgi:hypothetical protein